jgi:hypothetical protein
MKPSTKLFVYISTMLALAVAPAFGRSEEPFRLFVTGGFLGQLDGFQELPVAPYTGETAGVMKPWGGLDAASDWIARYYGKDKDFLLISPDNFPLHFEWEKVCPAGAANQDEYWKTFLTLNADAIGLGKEDLLRALHSGDDKSKNGRGQRLDRFLKWMRGGSCGLPLIASNMIVKETKQGINAVSSGPVKVHLSADESVPLTDQLVIEIDDEVDTAMAKVTLQVVTKKDGKFVPDGDPIPTSIKWEDMDGHDVTQRITPQPAIARAKLKGTPFLPGFDYQLIVEWNGDKNAVLRPLHTVQLVAPRTWANVPGSTKPKVPFQVITKGNVNIFAFDFIDPALKSLLPAEAWKGDDQNDRQEIVLQSPVETVQAWKSLIDAYCDSTRVCMLALISALDDPGTVKLLGKIPEFRLNIVSPETALLGRVARKEKNYSGDLGYHAEFNQSVPKATQVLLRPEWVGETVISVKGKVSPGAPSSLTISHIENKPVTGRIL